MDLLLGIILGVLLTVIFTKNPLKFEFHHYNHTDNTAISAEELASLEENMLKDDPKKDDLYEKLDETIVQVNEIMGGSDRQ